MVRSNVVVRRSGLFFFASSLSRFVVYACVGSIGTIFHYATLLVSVQFLGLNAVEGSTAGFAVGGLVNYTLNHRFTFKTRRPHQDAVWRFFVVAIMGACLNAFIVWLGVVSAQLHYLIVQLFSTACVLVLTYALNRRWTFE